MDKENIYTELPELSEKITVKLKLLQNGNLSTKELEALTENALELFERLTVLKFLALKKDYIQEDFSNDSTKKDQAEKLSENIPLDNKENTPPSAEFVRENTVKSDEAEFFLFEEEKDTSKEIFKNNNNTNALNLSQEDKTIKINLSDNELHHELTESQNNEDSVSIKLEVEEKTENNNLIHKQEDNSKQFKEKISSEIEQEQIKEEYTASTKPDTFLQNKETEQKHSGETLNEKYATIKVEKETIALKHEKGRIEDLRKAIGINKRFLFINELFKGKADEFNGSIDKLNQFTEAIDAFEFVQRELARKYHWDFESKTVSEFLDLVERRFME